MWSRWTGVFNIAKRICVPPATTSSVTAERLFPLNNIFSRNTSFFNKLPAEHIWKSVTSVSPAGAKKGRGKGMGRKRPKDLNRGQVIGVGKANIVWPGLSSPIIKGNELVVRQKLPEDPEREAKLIKLRDSMKGFRHLKLNPLERGWTGPKIPGRKFGPPDPIGEDTFEGFETICVEFKSLLLMRGGLGRTRKLSAMVVTGNSNGLAGFGFGKAKDGTAALRKARNRAGQKLMYLELYNNHTVLHDFFTQFGATKIFVWKKPEGYGLECHRVIKAICNVVGIKDLHAKVEGAINAQHIVKAFFLGLLKQKSHQQLAEEKQLHLVEYRKETAYYPKVVASPEVARSPQEIPSNEVLDFTQYALDGRVALKRKKFPPFYTRLPHWPIYLKKLEKRRNHRKIRIDMKIEHDGLQSFLTEKYRHLDEVAETQ